MANLSDAALTYNYPDFIEAGNSDDMTYDHFNIIQHSTVDYTQDDTGINDQNVIKFCTTNILDFYMDLLKTCDDKDEAIVGNCIKVTEFSEEEKARFKYHPDLLSYYLYGTTQLDFLILLLNGIIDPKEFDFKRGYLILPKKSILKNFLSDVKNSEKAWIDSGDSI